MYKSNFDFLEKPNSRIEEKDLAQKSQVKGNQMCVKT
jgi:hypothetical protein